MNTITGNAISFKCDYFTQKSRISRDILMYKIRNLKSLNDETFIKHDNALLSLMEMCTISMYVDESTEYENSITF